MAELTCPKCGSTKVKKQDMLIDSKLGPKIGPLVPRGLTSHILELHICEKCGYVVELYDRGKTVRTR